MNLIKFALAKALSIVLLLLALGGCKTSSPGGEGDSREATRNDSGELTLAPKLYLRPTKNELCQIGPKNTPFFKNFLVEQAEVSKESELKMPISELEARMKSKVAIEMCSVELEDWIIKSLALGKPAPFDVAGVNIPWRLAKTCATVGAILFSSHHHIAAGLAIGAVVCDYCDSVSKDCK